MNTEATITEPIATAAPCETEREIHVVERHPPHQLPKHQHLPNQTVPTTEH